MNYNWLRRCCRACTLFGVALFSAYGLTAHELPPAQEYQYEDPPQGIFAEDWMEVYISGQKSGYEYQSFERQEDHIYTRSQSLIRMARGSAKVEVSTAQTTVETLSGRPLSFENKIITANEPLIVKGTIDIDNNVETLISHSGQEQLATFKGSDKMLMTWGMVREAAKHDFSPGTEYTMEILNPELATEQTLTATVIVRGTEEFPYYDQIKTGLRYDTIIEVGASTLVMKAWAQEGGRVLRMAIDYPGMPVEMLLTTRANALGDFAPAEIFLSSLFPLNAEIPNNANTVTYRLKRKDDVPLHQTIPETVNQQTEPQSDGSILVTVTRADHSRFERLPEAPDTSELQPYLASNSFVNKDDPHVRALIKPALGDASNLSPLTRAHKLCNYVRDYIEHSDLSVGFASAAEVAKNRSGDCTEYSVLLAALARANGIPSRLAAGVIYMPLYQGKEDVMGYHVWVQLYLGGEWVDFDPSQGETSTSPRRIALATNDLQDSSLSGFTLSLSDYLGNVTVELVNAE